MRTGSDELVGLWREHRSYLVDLAFRMLGNIQDAEDAVQEAFTRLLKVDVDELDDVRGWLVVVVSRICLDVLRSARTRHEAAVGAIDDTRSAASTATGPDPADRVSLDDSVRIALLVVLNRLTPPERAAFVLHDVFQFPFESVAEIVGRSPAACRQLASRARRRIESETDPGRFVPHRSEHDELARRFIAACSGGDVAALAQLLDPDVVGDVDLGPDLPPRAPLHGRDVVIRNLLGFFGPRSGAVLVSQPINGEPGVLAFRDGQLLGIVVCHLREDGLIADIHALADPVKLRLLTALLASA
jgi:RNA polymerase sigma-70 factor (ECF subfamily)